MHLYVCIDLFICIYIYYFIFLYTTPYDTSELLLALDAEKAFDCVEWDFNLEKQFGFGLKFTLWVKIMYY